MATKTKVKPAGKVKQSKPKAEEPEAPKRTETAPSKSRGGSSFYKKLGGQVAKTKKEARGGSEFWTPEEGKNFVRPVKFIHDGEEELYVWDAKHWGEFAGEKKAVTCLGKENDCPICDLEDEVSADLWNGEFGNKDKQGIKARGRILMNVIVRGKDDENDRLVVAAFAPSVVLGSKNGVGMASFFDPDDADFCDPLDPDDGRDFVIEKTGKGMTTRYKVRLANKSSELGMDVTGKDLYQYITETTNEEYESAVDAIREMTDERGRKSGKRKQKDEDEDSEDE